MLKKRTSLWAAAALLSVPAALFAKTGLMIIAHGAPMSVWNQPVFDMGEQVRKELKGSDIAGIKVAMLEFAEPSVATVMAEFAKEGFEHVLAVPLFIAPSSHSHFDIPAVLGIYSDPDIAAVLAEESAEIASRAVPVTLLPTLAYDDIICQILVDRAAELSRNPVKEALVILAHGDPMFAPFWEKMCRETGAAICGETGITYFDYAFIEMGQGLSHDGASAIYEAASKRNKVIVVGAYVASSIAGIAKHFSKATGSMDSSVDLFADVNVVWADKGLLPDERVARWITGKVLEYLE